MVTFDAHAPGTSSTRWQTHPSAGGVPSLDLAGVSQLIVIAAHPDDETLAAGGLIAECSRRGIPVRVVIVTDGAGSHPGSTTHSPDRLRQLRSDESRSALSRLSPNARLVQLDLPDGGLLEATDRLREALEHELEHLGPDALVVANWAGDGHRDHRLVGEAVAAIATDRSLRVLGYPIWFWHWGEPDDAPWDAFVSLELDAAALGRKRVAIEHYRSQLEPLSPLPEDHRVLEPYVLEHFRRDHELFVVGEVASIPPAGSAMPGEYFDELYARRDDPWRFEERWYEARKRALTLAALRHERYRSVLELGCSIGVLTEQLADRADRVIALDISERAIEIARRRLHDRAAVELHHADMTAWLPSGRFDLIVLSEVGYYLDPEVLDQLATRLEACLADDGELLVCHWRHPVADYRMHGDAVHARLAALLSVPSVALYDDADVLVEVFARDRRSVAQRTGLA